ncbi:hypothetical protein BKA64DRAFT_744873 [Cadophora sp. MPI-SDFR-AT-0126]|nr:hypothetical protein BKA64DRAFT_744873 [Leotiomycetes sp. MPI-SDFR-AT-0126]
MKFIILLSSLAIGAQTFSIPFIPKRETGITVKPGGETNLGGESGITTFPDGSQSVGGASGINIGPPGGGAKGNKTAGAEAAPEGGPKEGGTAEGNGSGITVAGSEVNKGNGPATGPEAPMGTGNGAQGLADLIGALQGAGAGVAKKNESAAGAAAGAGTPGAEGAGAAKGGNAGGAQGLVDLIGALQGVNAGGAAKGKGNGTAGEAPPPGAGEGAKAPGVETPKPGEAPQPPAAEPPKPEEGPGPAKGNGTAPPPPPPPTGAPPSPPTDAPKPPGEAPPKPAEGTPTPPSPPAKEPPKGAPNPGATPAPPPAPKEAPKPGEAAPKPAEGPGKANGTEPAPPAADPAKAPPAKASGKPGAAPPSPPTPPAGNGTAPAPPPADKPKPKPAEGPGAGPGKGNGTAPSPPGEKPKPNEGPAAPKASAPPAPKPTNGGGKPAEGPPSPSLVPVDVAPPGVPGNQPAPGAQAAPAPASRPMRRSVERRGVFGRRGGSGSGSAAGFVKRLVTTADSPGHGKLQGKKKRVHKTNMEEIRQASKILTPHWGLPATPSQNKRQRVDKGTSFSPPPWATTLEPEHRAKRAKSFPLPLAIPRKRDSTGDQNGHKNGNEIESPGKGFFWIATHDREEMDVLYRENAIFIHSEDIYHLEGQWPNIRLFPGLKIPKKNIWRHNPLGGVRKLVIHPSVENYLVPMYDSPVLDGYMEPHVFARFQHIISEVNFGGMTLIPGTPTIDSMFIDESDEMKAHFLIFMGRSTSNPDKRPAVYPLSLGTSLDLEQAIVIALERLGKQFKDYQSFKPLMDLTNIQRFSPTMCFFHGRKPHTTHGPSSSMVKTLDEWKEAEGQWKSPLVKKRLQNLHYATECQRRAFAKYVMPSAAKYYGLEVKKLRSMVKDEKYGESEYAVQDRSGLGCSELGSAEAEMLGSRGRVPLESELSTQPPPPSSMLSPFPDLDLCPCDRHLVLSPVLSPSPCPDPCHCDDCFVHPVAIPLPCEEDCKRRAEKERDKKQQEEQEDKKEHREYAQTRT